MKFFSKEQKDDMIILQKMLQEDIERPERNRMTIQAIKSGLIHQLGVIIRQQQNEAEELIQDCNNEADADKCFARIEAYQNVIEIIDGIPN